MTKTAGRTIVKNQNGVELVREYYYGFGCNSLDVNWIVQVDGCMVTQAQTRKAVLPAFNREVAKAEQEAKCQARADEQSAVIGAYNASEVLRVLVAELAQELVA